MSSMPPFSRQASIVGSLFVFGCAWSFRLGGSANHCEEVTRMAEISYPVKANE
jgi:hypothetical protein